MYPDGPPERYLRALFAMANDAAVRRKAAWLIEQQSRFSRSHLSPRRPEDIIGHCLYVTAWNIASGRTALKLQEVAERRATLLEAAALARAEAEAAASLGYRDNALRLKAADIETLAASRYPENDDDPALVVYRNCSVDSAQAVARGTLRALAWSLFCLYGSPLTGVAAAFVSAAAGVSVSVTRDQARLATKARLVRQRPKTAA